MRALPWLRLGAVATFWIVVGGAALCGWMVGKHDAASEYTELQRRLTAASPPARKCGVDFELLDLRREPTDPPGERHDGPTQIAAPGDFLRRSPVTPR